MKKNVLLCVALACVLALSGCGSEAPNVSPSEGLPTANISFVSGMGCDDPTCTDASHHHDCPPDCADYDHHHHCGLDCNEPDHHHDYGHSDEEHHTEHH